MIIWRSWPEMPVIMHDTGIRRVYITHDIVTIPSLAAGGSILDEDENIINLDSLYTISKKSISIEKLHKYRSTVKMDKRLKSKMEMDHLAGEVARAFGIQSSQIEQL